MRFRVLLPIAILLLPSVHLDAQTPALPFPTPAQVEEMRKSAERMMNPAANALAYRAELELTEAQIAALDPISEQMTATFGRIMAGTAARPGSHLSRAMADPTVEIDEERIRAESCEQAHSHAEVSVALLRTQRSVDAVLSATQRERLQGLQASFGLQLMQQMMRPSPKH